MLSLTVITAMGAVKAETFIKKGAFWLLCSLAATLFICTIIAGFMGNLALMGLLGGGTLLTAIAGGLTKLFSNSFSTNAPDLIQSTQKAIQEKNKSLENKPKELE